MFSIVELSIARAGPAVCQSPGCCGTGVAAVGPRPLRLPPPDRQRPRGETTGVEASTVTGWCFRPASKMIPPVLAAAFAAAVTLG